MSQTERIMAIIDKLSSRNGRLTTKWITDNYEVTDRQARRDIEYIRDRLICDYFGSTVDLVYDRKMHEYRLTGKEEELEKLFAKSVIASAVASSASDPLLDILEEKKKPLAYRKRVKFLSQASELVDYTIFSALMEAISDARRVHIHYKNINRIDSERIVEPLELINYSSIWYVNVYDLSKNAIRTFSLSRITMLEVLDEKIEFSDYEKLNELDRAGYGIFTGGEIREYTIQLINTAAYIVSNQIWHPDQKGKWIDNNTYELTVPASDDRELLSKVLSYGSDAMPVAPAEFVSAYNLALDRLVERRRH